MTNRSSKLPLKWVNADLRRMAEDLESQAKVIRDKDQREVERGALYMAAAHLRMAYGTLVLTTADQQPMKVKVKHGRRTRKSS